MRVIIVKSCYDINMKNHAAFVIHDKDKILFIKRSQQKKTLPGAWSFPTGTQEAGETIEETATREAMEELGVAVEVTKTFATRQLDEFGVSLHFVLCSITDGEPTVVDESEIETFAWHTFADFFATYSDEEIGHGLVWLRAHPEHWQNLI